MTPNALCHREAFVLFDANRRRWIGCVADSADAVIEVHGNAVSVSEAIFRLGATRWKFTDAWVDFGWFRARAVCRPSEARAASSSAEAGND